MQRAAFKEVPAKLDPPGKVIAGRVSMRSHRAIVHVLMSKECQVLPRRSKPKQAQAIKSKNPENSTTN